jgi:hypothetical protein
LTRRSEPHLIAVVSIYGSEPEPTLRGPAAGQRVFGRYGLTRILGRGGMGVVWAARDETLGGDVALKFLPDAVRWDPAAFDDLKAETRRARQLTHPNIVRIHDFVEDASAAAISMELVNGKTLTELRLEKKNKIFEVADIAPWLPQLAAALDYAHTQARVVHRDLKPSNLMLTRDGVLKIADFGVARSLADSITRVSMMSAGTLVYMSPQQAMGEEPSPSDDLYALGATLYELLTGKPPFHSGDVRVQLFQRKPDAIVARRRMLAVVSASEIPLAWEKTIAACLAKNPLDRPTNVGEVAARLGEAFGRGRPGRGGARERFAAAWGQARASRPPRRALLAVACIALVGLAAWLGWPRNTALGSSAAPTFPSDATRALAAWNFDGDARDGSGRGLDGRAGQAVPTADRFGRIDRALHFNGNADVVVPDAPGVRWGGRQPFTAALWVRAGDEAVMDGDVWRSAGDSVGSLTWGLGFDRGHPAAVFGRVQVDGLGNTVQVRADAAAAPGEWHHFAVVSDGATYSLFVDGAKQAAAALGPSRDATTPDRVELRFGRAERIADWSLTGDLDDARLWRRALTGAEIAALASRLAPPRFAISQGVYSDSEDFATALRAEFGAEARLADWEDLKRLHADDPRAWSDELGLVVGSPATWLQRGGQDRFDPKRRYFLDRFDGVKPTYYLAHDEFGGMTWALGSWYGDRLRFLAALPPAAPRLETLRADATGTIRRAGPPEKDVVALALAWRLTLTPGPGHGAAATVRLRDGRELRAVCETVAGDALAVAVGGATDGSHTWQVAASYADCEYTLVVRDGLLRFRAVSVVGGTPLFQREVAVPGLRLADIATLEISGAAQSRLVSARLIIE